MPKMKKMNLRKQKIYEQLELSNKNLTILFETSKLLNSSLDLHELLINIKDIIIKKINYDYFSFFLLEDNKFILKESFRHPKANDKVYHIKYGRGITGHVAKTGVGEIVNDVSKDSRYICVRKDVKSELVVPIRIDKKIIGLINIESNRINHFKENDMYLLSAIAEQTAIAMKHIMAQELLATSHKRVQHLNDIGKAVNSSLKLDKVFNLIFGHRVTCVFP